MLAQSFKSAADLGITEEEQDALIHVLGMLERGELRYVRESTKCPQDDGFNIGTQGWGCGTPACIGGWAARLMGKDSEREMRKYVNSYMPHFEGGPDRNGLTTLYWRYGRKNISVEQAATALRSFLTIGDARWDLAVQS